jgi:serine/threonine-protein kinase
MDDEDVELQAAPQLVVANRYAVDLDAMIGAGGMALVYRGRDLRTRRPVALKTLRIEYRRDPETRARFRREVRTLAFLSHRNVVKIFDLYEDDEAPWAIMEYVEGKPLKDLVRERGRLSLEETASILEQTADALHYLHDHGLVHLDVKPQNLIIQPDGLVKLIDFGLAQQAQTPQELIGGTTFGTVSYLAPEQASGEKVDIQTDVYALGCVVYEMLTGRAPFDSDDGEVRHDVIRAHLEDEPVPPSQIEPRGTLPPSVDAIVLGALAKRPHDRFRDAPTFAAFFRNAVDEAAEERTSRRGVAGADEFGPMTVPTRAPSRAMVVEPAPHQTRLPAVIQSVRARRWLWRAVILLALLNLALGGLLVITRGELPPISTRPDSLGPGVEARVRVDQLNVRAAAGAASFVIDSVGFGTRLDVLGEAAIADDAVWWPVTIEVDGQAMQGYVWGGGVEPAGTGLPGAIQEAVDGLRQTIGEVTGWTP